MIPDIDQLRARRWLNDLNQERRNRAQTHFEYDLVLGSSTIELIERHSDLVLSLARFRYIQTQSSWRVQQQTRDGKFRAVPSMPVTPYLAELLQDVDKMRGTFIPSLRRNNDLLV
jgi:hypothetical protein